VDKSPSGTKKPPISWGPLLRIDSLGESGKVFTFLGMGPSHPNLRFLVSDSYGVLQLMYIKPGLSFLSIPSVNVGVIVLIASKIVSVVDATAIVKIAPTKPISKK